MPSWWSRWGSALSEADATSVVRRFVEASRRAEIVALLNSARTDREVASATVDELCEALEAEVAFVVVTRPDQGRRDTLGVCGLSAAAAEKLSSDPRCRAALGAARAVVHRGDDLFGAGARHLVCSPWTAENGRQAVVGVARVADEPFDAAELALLEAVTASVGVALERCWLGAERDRHAARQAALARAAKALSATLVVRDVLQSLSTEVAQALEADIAAVFQHSDGDAMELVAGAGLPASALGRRCEQHADSLCARAQREGRPGVCQPFEAGSILEAPGAQGVTSGLAVPMHLHGTAEGVVVIGFRDDRWIEQGDVEIATAFAELASVAYRNAADHAAAQRAASQDSLTGCLNHGAFQDRLREEIARARRQRQGLALVIVDLDDFKTVNDTLGHLAGDALLRGVADALRESVRAYDQVARYGGDEFAILLPDADEDTAREVVRRAMAAVSRVRLHDKVVARASAGLALWRSGEDANSLIERADRCLFDAKGTRIRPSTNGAGPTAGPRTRRRAAGNAVPEPVPARLDSFDQRAIAEATVIELGAALDYERCLLVRRLPDGALAIVASATPPAGSGAGEAAAAPDQERRQDAAAGSRPDTPAAAARPPADREVPYLAAPGPPVGPGGTRRRPDPLPDAIDRCLADRASALVRDPTAVGPPGGPSAGCAVLAVPVLVDGDPWGAIGLHSSAGFTSADVELVERIAGHLGTVLRAAELFDRLHLREPGSASLAHAVAELSVKVGRVMGLDSVELHDLGHAALLHDIGKLAIPDQTLNSREPLSPAERALIHAHPIVAEHMLAPIPALTALREIVRHDREHWDGGGYPDGLRGAAIPTPARIMVAVTAYVAMRSDRPYRPALSAAEAQEELRRHSGTQFDPEVVDALLAIVGVADPV
jgi:diguanylate cyclase (GGDEF)-like protein